MSTQGVGVDEGPWGNLEWHVYGCLQTPDSRPVSNFNIRFRACQTYIRIQSYVMRSHFGQIRFLQFWPCFVILWGGHVWQPGFWTPAVPFSSQRIGTIASPKRISKRRTRRRANYYMVFYQHIAWRLTGISQFRGSPRADFQPWTLGGHSKAPLDIHSW